MTLPHSTQRTLPASCSSFVTPSETRRPCVQMRGGLVGRVCETRPDSSWLTVHLRRQQIRLLADLRYRHILVHAMYATVVGRFLVCGN
jgi:hypothetical protein